MPSQRAFKPHRCRLVNRVRVRVNSVRMCLVRMFEDKGEVDGEGEKVNRSVYTEEYKLSSEIEGTDPRGAHRHRGVLFFSYMYVSQPACTQHTSWEGGKVFRVRKNVAGRGAHFETFERYIVHLVCKSLHNNSGVSTMKCPPGLNRTYCKYIRTLFRRGKPGILFLRSFRNRPAGLDTVYRYPQLCVVSGRKPGRTYHTSGSS